MHILWLYEVRENEPDIRGACCPLTSFLSPPLHYMPIERLDLSYISSVFILFEGVTTLKNKNVTVESSKYHTKYRH